MFGYVTAAFRHKGGSCHSKRPSARRLHNQIWAYGIASGVVLMWSHGAADFALPIHFKATVVSTHKTCLPNLANMSYEL